jgi:hypothetical protein
MRQFIISFIVVSFLLCGCMSSSNGGIEIPIDTEQNQSRTIQKTKLSTHTITPTIPAIPTITATLKPVSKSTPIPNDPPPLNTRDIQSVLTWFLYGLQNQDVSIIEALISPDGIRYAHYYEGVQFITKNDFIVQLNQRLGSELECEAITYYSPYYWQIWTTNWTPQWEMTELCYPDCFPLNPTFESSNAGFFFSQFNGEWLLDVNYLRTMEMYFDLVAEDYTALYRCTDFVLDKLVENDNSLFCPGAPTPRLEISGFAYVGYDPPLANRVRSKPGTENSIVSKIEPGGVMEILAGPKCVDNWVWWQVRELNTGLTGWTVEGDGKAYWLIPCESIDQCGNQ